MLNGENLSICLKINIFSDIPERCLARVWDVNNINRRCVNKVFHTYHICRVHLNNGCKHGLVNAYPDQELLRFYRTHDPNVDNKIFKKKIFIKKKSFNKTTMSLIVEDNQNNDKNEEILNFKKVIGIEDTLKLSKFGIDLNYFNKQHDDVSSLESLTIRDSNLSTCTLYISNIDHNRCLINSNKKFISSLDNWIDDDDEVPDEFKNADNVVLHPITSLPILEVKINKQTAIFCNICSGVYREYEFIEELDTFRPTNQILRNN